MDFSIELCPVTNPEVAIHKTVDAMPTVQGYEVPLRSIGCRVEGGEGWIIPLAPTGCDPFAAPQEGALSWEQETRQVQTAWGPSEEPVDRWIFKCSIQQGYTKRICQCFTGGIGVVYLVGKLGFNAGTAPVMENQATWTVEREDLPLPGEELIVILVGAGSGGAYSIDPHCAMYDCDMPDGDCRFTREFALQSSGGLWFIASTYFATPTWTGGRLMDYFTSSGGWAGLPETALTLPDCSVYGDESLMYKVLVEGEMVEVTSVGFAAYGIGTHVLLKKVNMEYNEPFSDSCLGVGEGTPEETIGNEKIGDSDGTFNPPLTDLSQTPINATKGITVKTSYDRLVSVDNWVTTEMTVSVDVDGNCTGDCTEGLLDVRTGEWLVDIKWTSIPNRDGADIDAGESSVISIVCAYTKSEEPAGDLVIIPWHVMHMGG